MTTTTGKISMLLLMGALGAGQARAAFICGDIVSGNVTLTNDIVCVDSGQSSIFGLVVGANDTNINLNGHTISCSGGGFDGSCQSMPGYLPGTSAPVTVGIISSNRQNVQINGPGTVSGFGTDVRLSVGSGLQVKDVTATGPPTPGYASNNRLFSVGILIADTTCPGTGAAAVVKSNEVTNNVQGIQLFNAQCVTLLDNDLHNNAGSTNNTPGIVLMGSSNNTVNKNFVHENGSNTSGANPAGAIQLMNGSVANTIMNNTVVNNCTNGISAFDFLSPGSTLGNTVVHNESRFNDSTNTLGGQCNGSGTPAYFDLTNGNAGANTWNPNNQCQTQGPGIPLGVCNAGE
jgi:hypothetical protein